MLDNFTRNVLVFNFLRVDFTGSLKRFHLYVVFFLVLFFLQFNSACADDDFPLAIDSRIKTFIYTATQIFPVNVNYGYQTFIEFSPSEAIKTIAPGDAVSWSITPSGNRVFIKALEKSGKTNLTVITNKRSYIFDLIAREISADVDMDLTYYVRFYYPEKAEDCSDSSGDANFKSDSPLAVGSKADFNYNYSFVGEKSIQPIEIFDNGKVTFFKFVEAIPKIFVLKDDNIEYASKMVAFGDYVAINGVHANITLRYKDDFGKLTNDKLSNVSKFNDVNVKKNKK